MTDEELMNKYGALYQNTLAIVKEKLKNDKNCNLYNELTAFKKEIDHNKIIIDMNCEFFVTVSKIKFRKGKWMYPIYNNNNININDIYSSERLYYVAKAYQSEFKEKYDDMSMHYNELYESVTQLDKPIFECKNMSPRMRSLFNVHKICGQNTGMGYDGQSFSSSMAAIRKLNLMYNGKLQNQSGELIDHDIIVAPDIYDTGYLPNDVDGCKDVNSKNAAVSPHVYLGDKYMVNRYGEICVFNNACMNLKYILLLKVHAPAFTYIHKYLSTRLLREAYGLPPI